MNSKLATQPKAKPHSHDRDDFAEFRDKEFSSLITKLRKPDNVTNWRYLAVEYLYLSAVIGLGFLLSVLWTQSVISTWLFVPLAICVSVLIGIGQHRLVMLCLLYTSPSPRDRG